MLHHGWGVSRALVLACALAPAACYFDYGEADPDGGSGADGSSGNGDGSIGPDGSGPGPDSGDPDGSVTPLEPIPLGPFATLSESMLYADMATYTVRSDVLPFEPEFKLWTDRAAKKRWIWIPPGSQIGTGNMARWVFPIGTTVWKEFSEPDTGKRYETRIIQRLENNPDNNSAQFYFATFIWNEDDTEAYFDDTAEGNLDIPAGCAECASPPCDQAAYADDCHVVPRANQCNECHGGEAYKVLGFSAVQLSYDAEPSMVDLDDLVAMGVLSTNPPAEANYSVPGTPVERAAIGYLHANCGHCHAMPANQTQCYLGTRGPDNDGVGMQARVMPGDATVQDTGIWISSVDQPLLRWVDSMTGNNTDIDPDGPGQLITHRIVSGDSAMSAIAYRMMKRHWGQVAPYDIRTQMPPVGTNEVDSEGLTAVETWINSLGQ